MKDLTAERLIVKEMLAKSVRIQEKSETLDQKYQILKGKYDELKQKYEDSKQKYEELQTKYNALLLSNLGNTHQDNSRKLSINRL